MELLGGKAHYNNQKFKNSLNELSKQYRNDRERVIEFEDR